MSAKKLVFAALLVLGTLNHAVYAQRNATKSDPSAGYPASPVDGSRDGSGYYAMFPGGVNYGLSGTFPKLGGYGYAGYGPGPQFGAHYPGAPNPSDTTRKPTSSSFAAPKPTFGLTNLSQTVQKVTKKPTRPIRPIIPGPAPIRTMP